MIVLAGGDLVLPHTVLSGSSLLIDAGRIVGIEPRPRAEPAGATVIDVAGCHVVPGFIDVHVHGVLGIDALDGEGAVADMASRLPRYGVTSFAPTTVACPPGELAAFLAQVRTARSRPRANQARVLPAHLESNFINPEYCGAQPPACLRLPPGAPGEGLRTPPEPVDYTGADILRTIRECAPEVGIVTLAPELPGALDLVRALVEAGHRVSLGHSGADFDTGLAAIQAGATQATHLFNRMAPMTHRKPGMAGAVLSRDDIVAEVICDGYHVHPAIARIAMAAKGADGIMAITDGTAGSGLAPGSTARLGGRTIHVHDEAAFLGDGTLAGSTLTMDRAFRTIVMGIGRPIVDAARMCATTPARALGLDGFGVLAEGAVADVVVLDRELRVLRTFIDGRECWRAS